MKSAALWICPTCGRQFSRKNQVHLCISFSVDDHFKNKPARLRKIFDLIQMELRKSGDAKVDAVRSRINLAANSHFASISVSRDSLNVGFVLNRKIDSPRVRRVQKITDKTFEHALTIREPSGVDKELLDWLKEAYLREQRRRERRANGDTH